VAVGAGGRETRRMDNDHLFSIGLDARREVLGSDYVDSALAASDDFMMGVQEAVTPLAWGCHGR
jgi:4-carboxymuconolactone decarboxylase